MFPPLPPLPPSSWPWYFKFGVPKRNLINWWRNQPHTNRESEMHHKAQLYWWRAATLMRWCCWGADAANALMSLMPDALTLLMQLMRWCYCLLPWFCWCIGGSDIMFMLMNLCCWYADAADALMLLILLVHWCCWCTDVADALMHWFCWCGDAAYELMLLLPGCCWCIE